MIDRSVVQEPANSGPQAGKPEVNRTSYYRLLFLDHGAVFEAWRKSYAVYWGLTSLIDDQLGRVLGKVEAQGLMDDTLIVYLSDHGKNLGARGLWLKMVAHEEFIRVPLIVRVPDGAEAPIRSELPVNLNDVAPSLAALCDLPSHDDLRGVRGRVPGDGVARRERSCSAARPP